MFKIMKFTFSNIKIAAMSLSLLILIPLNAFAARIVTLTSDVADIVVALDATNEVVGRESTTLNPALKDVQVIGSFRQLNIENIAAVKPTIAIGSWMAQPQSIFESLNKIGIKAVNVASSDKITYFASSIVKIGDLIGKSYKAKRLAKEWQDRVRSYPKTQTRYIISYDGRIVGGKNTAADELITRAGGINAAADIDGLKPMTREAWIEANPDVIIISSHNERVVGGINGFIARPEIAETSAGKNKQIYFWSANDIFRYGLDTPKIIYSLNQLSVNK